MAKQRVSFGGRQGNKDCVGPPEKSRALFQRDDDLVGANHVEALARGGSLRCESCVSPNRVGGHSKGSSGFFFGVASDARELFKYGRAVRKKRAALIYLALRFGVGAPKKLPGGR